MTAPVKKKPAVRKTVTGPLLAAETERALAEAELFRAQAADQKVERLISEARLRQADAEAEGAEMQARSMLREEQKYLAGDHFHRVYRYNEPITGASVRSCISVLDLWSRLDGENRRPVEVVFNSPGGSVIDGFALFDFLSEFKARGHHVTTICRGMAASMAGILLQAGDTRVIGRDSLILVHEVSMGGLGGKIGEIEDDVAFMKVLTKRVLRIFEDRTEMTARQIEAKWKRKDWWLDSDEAIKLGFADEVR